MNRRARGVFGLIAVILLGLLLQGSKVQALSSSTSYIMLYIDKTEAYINDRKMTLDAPAAIVNGSTYVPAMFLGDTFGIKVEWNAAARQIEMVTPENRIIFDSDKKTVTINEIPVPFDSVAYITAGGRLMIKLTWMADYMQAKYTWNNELRRVEILYVKTPVGVYNPDTNNSKPVAKFTTAKPVYRIGEPIKYVNLSYDVDAEGIADILWTGKQDAFFAPGSYPVTLTVKDRNGNVSDSYTRNVVVENTSFLSELEYPIYMGEPGAFIKTDWIQLYGNFLNRPPVAKETKSDTTRKLLVSDSPEEFTEPGLLYQDKASGKVRLYADHVNGTKDKMSFAVLVTNTSEKPVNLQTTNKGQVYPSVYANLIGNEASVDFLMYNNYSDKITIYPHQTIVYSQMPDFYPGQGMNAFFDVETDGEVQYSFATDKYITTDLLTSWKPLPFTGHVRGTFPASEIQWNVDAANITQTMSLTIGDNINDKFIEGFDAQRKAPSVNQGNYGVVYKIHADKPRKMAILFLPRGGVFSGPMKINGEFVKIPVSGVMTAFDGLEVLCRTTGKEDSLDLEFTPPAGSAFPIDLVFYPLDDRN